MHKKYLVCPILTLADIADPTDLKTTCALFSPQAVVPSSSQREKRKTSEKIPNRKEKINVSGKRIDTDVCQVDTDDVTGNRIDPEHHQVGTGDGIDLGVCQVNRQTINLPRMVGARRRQPISPL